MLQNGLYIGLSAWIHEQRKTGSFLAYPTLPFATELVDLEAVQYLENAAKAAEALTKAAEFSRTVNSIPLKGQFVDVFSSSSLLWEVHYSILDQMVFAIQPWTPAEQAEYQAARNILYTNDAVGISVPSPEFQLYQEMLIAYEDVKASGGTEAEINIALANWTVLGHKERIESALDVIGRLLRRSSLQEAEREKQSLDPDPSILVKALQSHGGIAYAPTYFAPISAMKCESWMRAKVTFSDLDRAVDRSQPSGKWKAYLANRVGEVDFDYVALTCIRSWFTPAFYEADDWMLETTGSVVSQGNGADGLLPAYIDAVYLVRIRNVTTESPSMSQDPNVRTPPKTNRTATITRATPFRAPLGVKSLGIAVPSKGVTTIKPLDAGGPRKGVTKTKVSTPVAMRIASPGSGTVHAQKFSSNQTVAKNESHFTSLNNGKIRKLTSVDLTWRYSVAQAYLHREPEQTKPPPVEDIKTGEIYVVGFGCNKIPSAPHPNNSYQWN